LVWAKCQLKNTVGARQDRLGLEPLQHNTHIAARVIERAQEKTRDLSMRVSLSPTRCRSAWILCRHDAGKQAGCLYALHHHGAKKPPASAGGFESIL
jgi:hypothetical protein